MRADDGTIYGIAAGSHFKPGYSGGRAQQLEDLEALVHRGISPAGPITHRWVNEDYTPMDGAPFVGWSSRVGTPYAPPAKAGHTNGTAAASPADRGGRGHPASRARRVSRGERQGPEETSTSRRTRRRLPPVGPPPRGAGARRGAARHERQAHAAYRDEDGAHAHRHCTHMGAAGRTTRTHWDCPAAAPHDVDGEHHGPAVTSLKKEDAGE